jgi:D-ribose pyranase
MKKTGILNAQLMQYIAGLGHTDTFLIGDAGMPVPKGVPIVDLVLTGGVPTFEQVLKAVLAETKIEFYSISADTKTVNPGVYTLLTQEMPGVPSEELPHTELKKMTQNCKFAIRTGEFTPFSNVVLQAGCVFI